MYFMDEGWMNTRASDSDRAAVAEQLREAAAEGRITIGELSERLTETMEAVTYSDLHSCLRELPEFHSYRPWSQKFKPEVLDRPLADRGHRPIFLVALVAAGVFLTGVVSWMVFSPILMFAKVLIYLAAAFVVLHLVRAASTRRR